MSGGAASAEIAVTGLGGASSGTVLAPSPNSIEWQTDSLGNLTLLGAVIVWESGFGSLSFGNLSFAGHNFFQGSGPCPGQPCGQLNYTSVSMVDLSVPVPAPIVGAGASSFVLAALLLGWLVRRRSHRAI